MEEETEMESIDTARIIITTGMIIKMNIMIDSTKVTEGRPDSHFVHIMNFYFYTVYSELLSVYTCIL